MAESTTRPQTPNGESEKPTIAKEGDQSTKDVTSINDTAPVSTEAKKEEQVEQYPPFAKVLLIMSALYLSTFLVALDLTIIGTATPRISDEFHALGDIGWYGSAYLLTTCCFQLLFGRIYTFHSPKPVFLTAVVLFEVGSAICGAAPNSTAFILGRAVAGIGAAGISNGSIVIMMHCTPVERRPVWIGFVGAMYGVASVAGPLLGGVFTSKVSWRWCFYVNLPIGGVAIAIIVLLLDLPSPKNAPKTIGEQIARLDPLGTLFFFPGIVCLLLALQWGGSTYAWSNARIIVLLVVFGLCMIVFVGIQRWKGDSATVPPRIFLQRSILSAVWFIFFSGAALQIMLYYLPIWFQVIKDVSPVQSGIMTLPIVLSLVIANIIAGGLVSAFGYYTPFLIASSIFMSIGCGLISTFTTTTGHSKWIAYQFLFGLGMGLGMQQPGMAAQASLPKKDVSTGVAVTFFFRNLGGAIFVSIGENVFENELIKNLSHIPGLNAQVILNAGATGLRNVVDSQYLQEVLTAYNGALVKVYYCAVAVSAATMVGALTMEWRNVKKDEKAKKGTKGDNMV
ncbi:hypothetical protein M426DRAFT_76619 [Hypoxylon sp. CI-4A]|nr:hypothetical protein M426DRAFT_76619 [Hypoxylon sp. CI-4A]